MTKGPPHHGRWYKLGKIPYEICAGCGLVALRNEISRWALRHGCDYKDDPGWPEALERLTR